MGQYLTYCASIASPFNERWGAFLVFCKGSTAKHFGGSTPIEATKKRWDTLIKAWARDMATVYDPQVNPIANGLAFRIPYMTGVDYMGFTPDKARVLAALGYTAAQTTGTDAATADRGDIIEAEVEIIGKEEENG
jgi:hypothetical protein